MSVCAQERALCDSGHFHHEMEKLIKHEEMSLQQEELLCLKGVQWPAVFLQTRMSLSELGYKMGKKNGEGGKMCGSVLV